ncbi:MAG: hypothetical protein V1853_00220, partial [bacterium]
GNRGKANMISQWLERYGYIKVDRSKKRGHACKFSITSKALAVPGIIPKPAGDKDPARDGSKLGTGLPSDDAIMDVALSRKMGSDTRESGSHQASNLPTDAQMSDESLRLPSSVEKEAPDPKSNVTGTLGESDPIEEVILIAMACKQLSARGWQVVITETGRIRLECDMANLVPKEEERRV